MNTKEWQEKERRKAPYRVKPPALPPVYKTWKPEALVEAIRGLLFDRLNSGLRVISAEDIAKNLSAPKGKVTAALQELGRQGLVGHKVLTNCVIPRDNWQRSVYTIIAPKR